jgi:dTDP-4-dehydrorhamnose 3,5-epimerase-like enzyme
MDYKLEKFQKFKDSRGDLIVFLRRSNLEPKYQKFGQIYFVTFKKKGNIRGNHYHKKWREWFGMVSGRVQVVLKDIKTGETKELTLNGNTKEYIRLEIGPHIAHAFKSLSNSAALLNYTDDEWSPDDVFPMELIK